MKICCKCLISKETINFFKKKASKDGLQHLCKDCFKLEHKTWRDKNKEKINIKTRNWYKENSEIHKKRVENWRDNHFNEVKESNKNWAKLNKEKRRVSYSKRRAIKKNAFPKWLTSEDLKNILDMYLKAENMTKETGIKHEVDHIIPLQGENVCGLHVPWNLQVISLSENRKKGNKIYGF